MVAWVLGTLLVVIPCGAALWLAAWWNMRQSEREFQELLARMDRKHAETMAQIDRTAAEALARIRDQRDELLAGLGARSRYTVNDGRTTLTLEPTGEGGYVVRSAENPGLVARATTIEEAFAKVEEALTEPAAAQ